MSENIRFDHFSGITSDHMYKNLRQLKDYCQNADIADFVYHITYPINHLELRWTPNKEYSIARNLCKFMYDLQGYDFESAITNEYHFQGNWIYELNSFIGNFFNDDSYFVLEKEDEFSCWEARVANDCDKGSQDPKKLINAAIENIELRNHLQEKMASAIRHYYEDSK